MEQPKNLATPKNITIVVLALLAVIFLIQNMNPTSFRILFIEIKMPGIIFYILLLGIGFVLGYLFSRRGTSGQE